MHNRTTQAAKRSVTAVSEDYLCVRSRVHEVYKPRDRDRFFFFAQAERHELKHD